MDDIDPFSSDEEEKDANEENDVPAKDPPSASPMDLSPLQISQKRSQAPSSLDSDKEASPSDQNCQQLVPVQSDPNGWVKVSKKKVKKCRLEVPTQSG